MGLQCTDRFRPLLGPSSVWYSTPATKLMLLHFAELVQWELAAAEWVAAVVVEGKKTFLFFWIFCWSLSSSPLLGASECAQVGCIVNKSATKLQLVLVTVSCCRKVFRTELSMYSILDLGLIVVATARHCFPSKVAGNVICSFHHRCSERVWARIRGAHRTVVFNLSTVAPLASSSLLRQHVGADLVNGWLRWVASTMLLWSVWCCACCFLYTGAVATADEDCCVKSMCLWN